MLLNNSRFFEADNGTQGGDQNPAGEPQTPESTPDTFKVFETEADFDRFMTAQRTKWGEIHTKDLDKKVQEGIAEALRKSQLSDKEKQVEADQAKDATIAELQAKIDLGERKDKALAKLQEANLDVALIDVLNLSDDDTMTASLDALAKVVPSAIQKAVDARLAASSQTVETGQGTATSWTKEKIMAVKDQTERLKLINDNQDLFTQ